MGRLFEQDGDKVAYVTLSRKGRNALARRGADVVCIQDVAADVGRRASAEAVVEAERRYGLVSLRDVYIADRATPRKSEARALEDTLRLFRTWEHYFDTHPEIDCVIPDVGAELIRRTAYFVCRRRGIRQILWFVKPFPNPLLLVTDDFHARLVNRDEVWGAPPPDADLQAARRFLAAFREDARPFVPVRRIRLSFRRLRRLVQMLADAAFVERGYQEHLVPLRLFRTNVARWLRLRLFRWRLYRRLDDRPFVLFPLHVTDDFKTSVMTPHCVHQDYFVRLCAAALPQGYVLAVKEHPANVGGEPVRLMRQLARLPNVRIVPPEASIKWLVSRAAAVTVLSSTTGLEALFLGKPVVTFGKPFYGGLGLTVDVDDVSQVRPLMRQALASGSPDADAVLRFVAIGMRRTFPGLPPMADRSRENLQALYGSLRRKLDALREEGTLAHRD
jgi:hypothetical protein